jgi:hypothetical protein
MKTLDRDIQAELRIPHTQVIALLGLCGTAVFYISDHWPAAFDHPQLPLLALSLYVTAAGSWLVGRWRPLAGRGVWWVCLGDMPSHKPNVTTQRDGLGYPRRSRQADLAAIHRLRGKVGMFLGVHGENRQDAIDRAKRLLDSL